jgi:flagellar motor switch protein FliM
VSEKILSQEEIDALYDAMADGKVEAGETSDVETAAEEAGARAVDFADGSSGARESFDVLDQVFDRLARQIRGVLEDRLRNPVEVSYISAEVQRFRAFLKGFGHPTSFSVFAMDPLPGPALLVMGDGLVFSFIDCAFGGTGRPVSPGRDFTQIEQRVVRRLVTDLLSGLETAWEVVGTVRARYRSAESNPKFVQVIGPDEPIMTAGFSVDGGAFTDSLFLCLPLRILEPIRDVLSFERLRDREIRRTPDDRLRGAVNRTPVTLTAELGRARMTIRGLLELTVGDVVHLDTGVESPVPVTVEGIVKLTGYPGARKGNRAIRIAARRDAIPENGASNGR